MKVFILGAGASHGCDPRVPLNSGFFEPSMLEAEREHLGKKASRFDFLLAFIKKEFLRLSGKTGPPVQTSHLLPELNVEEVFLHLEELIESTPQGGSLYAELLLARSQLLEYVAERLRYQQPSKLRLFRKLADLMSQKDSVISFNWDVLFDTIVLTSDSKFSIHLINQTALFRPGAGYVKSGGFFLKLHGSLNWYICGNAQCPVFGQLFRWGLGRPHSGTLEADTIEELDGAFICPQCSVGLTQGIVPPYAGKRLHMSAPIRAQWAIAKRVLREADEWIFVGYSLPDLDVEARSLFRSSSRQHYWSLEKGNWAADLKTVHIADLNAQGIKKKLETLMPVTERVLCYHDLQDFLLKYGKL